MHPLYLLYHFFCLSDVKGEFLLKISHTLAIRRTVLLPVNIYRYLTTEVEGSFLLNAEQGVTFTG